MHTLTSELIPDFTVVIPVYNSASTLERLHSEIAQTFERNKYSYEVIFVDDASSDGVLPTLKELQKRKPETVKYISLNHNHGQHVATFCGVMHSTGKYIITIDDDLETPPSEIDKLINCFSNTNADLVYGMPSGSTEKNNRGVIRAIGGSIFKKILSKGSESNGKGSSFRMFNGTIREKLYGINFEFIFLDEILHWHAYRIAHTPIESAKRVSGKSGYSLIKLISISIRILFNYSDFPIKLMILGGMFSVIICSGFGGFHIYNKLFNNVQLGFASLITAIFFATGVILFSLGIIGEYLRKIHFLRLGKQNFKIKDSSF